MTRLLAAVTLAFALMASPALAAPKHPHHRHHHHHHRAHEARLGAHSVHSYRRLYSDPMNFAPYVVGDARDDRYPAQGAAATAPGKRVERAASALVLGTSALVNEARRSIGETASELGVRRTLWCMAALNKWLSGAGRKASGSDQASSALKLGPHVSSPQVGAIAFMYRRGGSGHVGVVTGVDGNGNPIIISGNHNHFVRESVYPRSIIHTYVLPDMAGSG